MRDDQQGGCPSLIKHIYYIYIYVYALSCIILSTVQDEGGKCLINYNKIVRKLILKCSFIPRLLWRHVIRGLQENRADKEEI